MIRRRFQRAAAESLPESLLSIASSLFEAQDADELLGRLTDALAERGVSCALLLESGRGADLVIERSTLPLAPEVWGRGLRLPRLAATLARGRPALHDDPADAFTEQPSSGGKRALLAQRTSGRLIAAPLRLADGRAGLLCLVSRDLQESDVLAVWSLALELGHGLALPATNGHAQPAPAEAPPAAVPVPSDVPLFHELTRRLSYSLSDEEVVEAGLEVLAPAADFQLAAGVSCHEDEHVTTVYVVGKVAPGIASGAAAEALDAFAKLTGARHRSCARPPFRTVTLALKGEGIGRSGRVQSALDAPLVVGGEVRGLLRIASGEPDAFDAGKERTFYTVANQLALALERSAAIRSAERAQLASLAESLSDGIVLVDDALHVTSRNAAAGELLALLESASIDEGGSIEGTPLGDLAREALSSQKPTSMRELTASAASGRRWLQAMAAPLAGTPEGSAAVVVLRDATEERLMQERLLQSEKMVSVGQLVSGVAHELNNPLTGIMGFAQLLLARDLDETTERDVGTIYTEAERAAKIVQNLLSFARRKRAEKELVNLNVLIERVLELRTYDLRVKNIDVALDLDKDLPQTMVDANQIQQVVLNVIINAEQAMLASKGAGTLRVRSRAQDGSIRISFQDDGPGMEPETLRRIFDPFFTTKETGEGTGLGLTISYGIVDEHGGRIWAESQPGRGTTFVIELPVVSGPGRPSRVEAEPEAAVAARSVLVVDDEESIQRLLGSILEMDGHQVDTASNGTEALWRLSRRRYDIVITDIKMPDMDGRELYRRLLEINPELAQRTVFITGDTVSPETRTFLESVDNPCLAKPFKVREVRETIGRMLEEAE